MYCVVFCTTKEHNEVIQNCSQCLAFGTSTGYCLEVWRQLITKQEASPAECHQAEPCRAIGPWMCPDVYLVKICLRLESWNACEFQFRLGFSWLKEEDRQSGSIFKWTCFNRAVDTSRLILHLIIESGRIANFCISQSNQVNQSWSFTASSRPTVFQIC